jgi:hypothetical protein
MRRLAVLFVILPCFLAQAQKKVIHSREPGWVEHFQYKNVDPDSSGSSNGYAYLLISVQQHLETKESFRKYAVKVVSEQGLSFASSINESFDPSYQKIIFHTLNIVRNGSTIDMMDANKFEVIRREEAMDRLVYDKRLNAVYNLPGVKVGDIVEYSFTIKGANPAFNNHAFGNFYLQYGVPVSRFAFRLVYNQNRPVQLKSSGNTGTHKQFQEGNLRYHEWIHEDVPALLSDDMLPSWYDPYAHVQYSDFQSWNEMKSWARSIFDLKDSGSNSLNDAVNAIKNMHVSDEEKIKECIRMVQADIRYLSFSDGIHSYTPHAEHIVFDQKYGDCKDKSLLLSYLLNTVGVESHPALVSTEIGQILNDILPNPWAFDHCIVQFHFNDSTYWIDPTLNPQVGPLKSYRFPSYQNALVINDLANGLDSIPDGYKDSKANVREEYFMDEVGGYVTLKVKSEFFGDEADIMRNYVKTNTKDEIHKDFLNFYAKDYSEISLEKDVAFSDDEASNVITSTEEYLLKNFWTSDPEKGKVAYLYARVLASYLRKPDTKLRTMPLAIKHPQEINQTIKIYLPEEWGGEDCKNYIESDGFVYRNSCLTDNKTITLRYSFKTKAPFVLNEDTKEHLAKMDDVFNDISYTIWKELEEEGTNTNQYIFLAFLIAVGIYVIKKRLG